MAITIKTEKLRNALSKILSIIDKKSTHPILTYTQMTFNNNEINLLATDLEVSASVTIESESVDNIDHFCVNAKNLFDILKEMPDGNVEFDLVEKENEHLLSIRHQEIYYSLLVYNNDDFPHLIFDNKENQFSISSKNMIEMINKTSHAISYDDTRPYLNGVFLQELDGKIRAVATDGHRLALYEIDYEGPVVEILTNGFIIPKKGIQELKKLAESTPEMPLNISADDSFLYISDENKYKLSIRLISREYPKYQAVIPSRTVYSIRVDRNSFLDAIRRIKIMSNEKSNGVRIHFSPGEVLLKANHPSLGDARETIPMDYDGKNMEIGFNAKYLIDTLTTLTEKDVTIELNNELSPIVIKSPSIPQFLGIIMPLKL